MSDEWRYHLTPKRRGGKLVTWMVNVYNPNGQRSRYSLGTSNRKDAEEKLKIWARTALLQLKSSFDYSRHDSVDPTIAEIVDYYLNTHQTVKNPRARTTERITPVIRDFALFCRASHVGRISQLSRVTVDKWAADLSERGQAAKTIKVSIGFVRAMIYASVDAGLIEKSPIAKWLMPVLDESEIHPLDPDGLSARLEAVKKHEPLHYPAIAFIAMTGNRPEAMTNLLRKHVDLKTLSIVRPQKTRRLARYNISPECASIIATLCAETPPDEPIFKNPNTGKPYEKKFLLRAFKRAQAAAGFKRQATLKDLRHTYGYIMANIVKMPLQILQVQMGHSDIKTTMKYVKPGDGAEYCSQFDGLIRNKKPLKTRAPAGTTPAKSLRRNRKK